MRHHKRTGRLSLNKSKRNALLKNLVSSLLNYQRIKTTPAKAKEAGRLADKLITLGKRGGLASERQAFDILRDRTLTTRLFKEIAPLFKNRTGGYTRIFYTNSRPGDGADTAILELTEQKVKEVPKAKPTKEKLKPAEKPKLEAPTPTPTPEAPKAEAKPEEKPKEKKGFTEKLRDWFKKK